MVKFKKGQITEVVCPLCSRIHVVEIADDCWLGMYGLRGVVLCQPCYMWAFIEGGKVGSYIYEESDQTKKETEALRRGKAYRGKVLGASVRRS